MMVVKLLAMRGVELQLNSNKIEQLCESFKKTLLDEKEALALFLQASQLLSLIHI